MRLALSLLFWAAACALIYYLANRQIYYPIRYPAGFWNLQSHYRASDVWLQTADGKRIHAWWIPVQGARLATLFLHGNAGNLSHRGPHLEAIPAAGSALLLLDYRGYGRSEGSPTESGLYKDADAAYEWLIRQGFPPGRIVLHGESLGTAVAIDLAARKPCAGLVLEAPFPSGREVAARVLPLIGPLLIHSYDSRAKIGRVKSPILILHGDRDEVIPWDLGRALFDAAPEPKTFRSIPGAGHNDLLDSAGPAYVQHLREFYAAR